MHDVVNVGPNRRGWKMQFYPSFISLAFSAPVRRAGYLRSNLSSAVSDNARNQVAASWWPQTIRLAKYYVTWPRVKCGDKIHAAKSCICGRLLCIRSTVPRQNVTSSWSVSRISHRQQHQQLCNYSSSSHDVCLRRRHVRECAAIDTVSLSAGSLKISSLCKSSTLYALRSSGRASAASQTDYAV